MLVFKMFTYFNSVSFSFIRDMVYGEAGGLNQLFVSELSKIISLIDIDHIMRFTSVVPLKGIMCFVGAFLSLPITISFFVCMILSLMILTVVSIIGSAIGVTNTSFLFIPAIGFLLIAIWIANATIATRIRRRKYRSAITIPLICATDAGIYATGYKGYTAGVLKNLLLNTPDGFILNGTVFYKWTNSNSLQKDIKALLDSDDAEEKILELLNTRIFPRRLTRIIKKSTLLLHSDRVIIRSSFPGEDTGASSMSGVFKSVVSTNKTEDIEQHLKEVWASYFSKTASENRKRCGYDGNILRLPVLIQAYVPHEFHFTCCSVNPIAERLDEMVIEYETEDAGSEIVYYDMFRKSCYCIASSAVFPYPESVNATLVDVMLRLEARFDKPIQIEAGWHDGILYIYQARPLVGFHPVETFVNSFIVDIVGHPMTPLTKSLMCLPDSLDKHIRSKFNPFGMDAATTLISEINMRLYLRYNTVRKFLNPYFLSKIQFSLHSFIEKMRVYLKVLSITSEIDLSFETCLENNSIRGIRDRLILPLYKMQLDIIYVSNTIEQDLKGYLRHVFSGKPGLDELINNLKLLPNGSPYLDMINELSCLDASSLESVKDFQVKHGHWGNPEAEVSSKRIADDISLWLPMASASTNNISNAEGNLINPGEQFDSWFDELGRGFLFNIPKLLFHFLCRKLRIAVLARENIRQELNKTFFKTRLIAESTWSGENSFFMSIEEIVNGGVGIDEIEKRKASYSTSLSMPEEAVIHIPEFQRKIEIDSDSLRGLGVGSGIAEGTAFVGSAPSSIDTHQKPILIIKKPDCVFASMLNDVSAVVIESGSTLSHLVLLAREAGLPVLVGVRDATRLIKTGDIIRVDAGKGMVIRV